MRTVSTGVRPNARLVSTKCHIQAVSAMVARGVRSRALRAHPFCDRLYSALVRYDDSEPKRCPLRVRPNSGAASWPRAKDAECCAGRKKEWSAIANVCGLCCDGKATPLGF
jgi:hypothetical protein